MIRSHILFENKLMLEAYGHIASRAWKVVDVELKEKRREKKMRKRRKREEIRRALTCSTHL